jgi:hypothetical protein
MTLREYFRIGQFVTCTRWVGCGPQNCVMQNPSRGIARMMRNDRPHARHLPERIEACRCKVLCAKDEREPRGQFADAFANCKRGGRPPVVELRISVLGTLRDEPADAAANPLTRRRGIERTSGQTSERKRSRQFAMCTQRNRADFGASFKNADNIPRRGDAARGCRFIDAGISWCQKRTRISYLIYCYCSVIFRAKCQDQHWTNSPVCGNGASPTAPFPALKYE